MAAPSQARQCSYEFDSSFTNHQDQERISSSRKNSAQRRRLLTGPIPPTPGYADEENRDTNTSGDIRGVARVHGSEAKAIHKRATNGTGVPFLFEIQGTSLLQTQGTAAKPPINHLNENVKRIRHVTRESRERRAHKEQDKTTPVKALWHSKHYNHIQSKVKQQLQEDSQRSLSRPQSARHFLRAHENTGAECVRCQSAAGSRRASIVSHDDVTPTPRDNESKPDYIKLNSEWAKSIPKARKTISEQTVEQVRAKQDQQLKDYHEKQKGRVPNYIEKMKEQRNKEIHDALANAPDPDCPAGHVRMNDETRLSTLRQLMLSRAGLEQRLNQLPLRNDSLTLRRTKEELEKKIIGLDEAIEIFSKSKVFVKSEE